jgi:hypothetical protein
MKIKLFLTAIVVAGILLSSPTFSNAQKAKVKKTPNQLKKTTKKAAPQISSVEVKAPEAEWQKFTSQEGGFSILFPTEPQTIQQDSATSLGKVTKYVYTSSEDSENVNYAILAQTALPDWSLEDDSEYKHLQLLQQHIIPANAAETLNISTKGRPAVQWLTNSPTDYPAGWLQLGKAFRDMRTRRLYIITFTVKGVDRAKKFAKNGNKFLDSFNIF